MTKEILDKQIDDNEEAFYYELEQLCRPYSVTCNRCGDKDGGTWPQLLERGWQLSPKGEFCSEYHQFDICCKAAYLLGRADRTIESSIELRERH